jgi:hypothetical protein
MSELKGAICNYPIQLTLLCSLIYFTLKLEHLSRKFMKRSFSRYAYLARAAGDISWRSAVVIFSLVEKRF